MISRMTFFIRLLACFILRDMRRHPGRSLIVIIGIAMGAAVFASVRLSIDATMDSFTKSVNLIAGQADLVVTRPGGVVPEGIITPLLNLNPRVELILFFIPYNYIILIRLILCLRGY